MRAGRGRRTVVVALAMAALGAGAGCARQAHPSLGRPAAPSVAPRIGEDHWHAAFGIYVCDRYLPDLPQFESASGIHTHGDGIIHVHPIDAAAAGDNARLGLFLRGAGVSLSDDRVAVDGKTYAAGDDCQGRPAVVEVAHWADVAADASPEVVTHDAGRLRFAADGEGYAIAVVPAGTHVPKPPTAADVAELEATESAARKATPGPAQAIGAADGFHPVRAQEPATGSHCRAGLAGDGRGGCYQVGDEHAVGIDAVASARSQERSGAVSVTVTLTASGRRAFNVLAADCYRAAPACATRRVALVVDGTVVSAPAITSPRFERTMQISGSFTTAEAQAIAKALND